MKYQHIVQAEFLERPNRFIAYVNIDGIREKVHVKNTGRCRELLVKGATVYLEKSDNPNRSTAYDLVAVQKGDRLINMDSQAPNKVVEEWLHTKALFPDVKLIRPETKYGNSRFDFYVETEKEKIFIEVKGCTLEEEGVTRFPDAPSERAVKHVEELVCAKQAGYRVMVIFVIQMEDVAYFIPNRDTHEAFADALQEAVGAGVEVLAYDCKVTPESLIVNAPVTVKLTDGLTDEQRDVRKFNEKLRFGELSNISKFLLKWYDTKRRVLPWREEPTPYRVWVSEIMLQQTRVEAVKPYFERFMKALPDIKSLAEAEEETLLKLWEGLGHYNRVRNLQKAAIQIMQEHGGQMPADYEELLKLKGIGSYTAGAISSIAFNKVYPAVDGNVLRVLARIRKDDRLITDSKVKSLVERELLSAMPVDRPGDFNQAMMELGACVCIPNGAPHCEECPLNTICMAKRDECQSDYPKKAGKKARTIEEKTILIIRDEDKAAIRKRDAKGLLAGMYELPSMDGFRTAEEVVKYLADRGIRTIRIQALEDAKHIFSHREWHMKGYMVRVDELATDISREAGVPNKTPTAARQEMEMSDKASEEIFDWIYIQPEETREKYPIPAAFAAYTDYLNIKLGQEKFREDL